MSLNYKTIYLDGNSSVSVFKAPHVMRRIFLGAYLVAQADTNFSAHISFDDPHFVNYLEIWLNDKNSSDVIVLAVNTGATVNRQFEQMEYIIGEGTPIRFKQKE